LAYFGFPRVITQVNFRDPYFVYQLFSLFVAGAFTVLYYWRIAFHLSRVTKLERSNFSSSGRAEARRST
jgi:hypothetical protein